MIFTLGLQHRYSGTPKLGRNWEKLEELGPSLDLRKPGDFGLGKGLATDQASSSGVGLGGLRMPVMRN